MIGLSHKKGFALLYAILLSGAVLAVGLILMNIITKQLIYSSVNRNSELAYYYAANSGRECLSHYADTNKFYNKRFDPDTGERYVVFKEPVFLECFESGPPIEMTKDPTSPNGKAYYLSDGSVTLGGNKIELSVTFNTDCILENTSCAGQNLEDRSIAVMKAIGYSGSADNRGAKRVAIEVKKPF